MCTNNMKRNGNSMEPEASFTSRCTAVSALLVVLAVWAKYTFVPEETATPGRDVPMHSYKVPLTMTVFYLISLPVMRYLTPKDTDLKPILKESMILYNVAQVALNFWMVYRFVVAVVWNGHPIVGSTSTMHTGTVYVIWVHYCDKYLEFLDTYFMVLRGKMDQVSFLHVYHHCTIAWAWWVGMTYFPAGDSYFGALFNSWIHVMMYSYYALSLLKIQCPWKKYLTMAQLFQFASVIVYSFVGMSLWRVEEGANKWHYIACMVQIWEMLSLFLLFQHFYKKSYSKAKVKTDDATLSTASTTTSSNKEDDDDQCQVAVAATTETFTKAANAAITVANKEGQHIARAAKKHLGQL